MLLDLVVLEVLLLLVEVGSALVHAPNRLGLLPLFKLFLLFQLLGLLLLVNSKFSFLVIAVSSSFDLSDPFSFFVSLDLRFFLLDLLNLPLDPLLLVRSNDRLQVLPLDLLELLLLDHRLLPPKSKLLLREVGHRLHRLSNRALSILVGVVFGADSNDSFVLHWIRAVPEFLVHLHWRGLRQFRSRRTVFYIGGNWGTTSALVLSQVLTLLWLQDRISILGEHAESFLPSRLTYRSNILVTLIQRISCILS